MPKAYDYDLRRKVIEAIELNGMKRWEASELFGISRNTIINGFKSKPKREMLNQSLQSIGVIATKSLIGKHSEFLWRRTQTRRKPKWQSCGKTISVNGQ
jgi:transposase